ncbi:hypothetical protein D3C87_2174670 [compost metagenome]
MVTLQHDACHGIAEYKMNSLTLQLIFFTLEKKCAEVYPAVSSQFAHCCVYRLAERRMALI